VPADPQAAAPNPRSLEKGRAVTVTQLLSNIATVVAVGLSLYTALKLSDIQELESRLSASLRKQDRANLDLRFARGEQNQLQRANRQASDRLADLQGQGTRLSSQLLLAEADLKTRMQDVATARVELARITGLVSVTEAARKVAVETVARTTLTAFVATHLSRVRERMLRERNSHVMLYDAGDPDFPGQGYTFMGRASGSGEMGPGQCRLSERFLLSPTGPSEEAEPARDRIVQMLCAYLHETDGLVRLEDAVRAYRTERSPQSLQRWENLGNDGPFLLSLVPGETQGILYEKILIGTFWSGLEVAGMLSVPGTRQLLLEEESEGDPAGTAIAEAVDGFVAGWEAYAQHLWREGYGGRDILSLEEGDGELPTLQRISRISAADLRAGPAATTRSFEESLLCAAASYARERGVVEEFTRSWYCNRY
jgi:hypothetical protein